MEPGIEPSDGDPPSLIFKLEKFLGIFRPYLEKNSGNIQKDLVDAGNLSK